MIYLLHEDPTECAKMLSDDDLDKQIKAIRDVLIGIVLNSKGEVNPYSPEGMKLTKCPYRLWASECRANYLKLVEIGLACCEEYNYRNSITSWGPGTKPVVEVQIKPNHKLQPVIEWARDNVPDLPIRYAFDSINRPEELVDGITTPFPLVMNEKYLPKLIPLRCVYNDDKIEWIQMCYRNYYRAKLGKRYKKVICENCTGSGSYYSNDIDTPELIECSICEGKMFTKELIIPKWTRREKPTWVNI